MTRINVYGGRRNGHKHLCSIVHYWTFFARRQETDLRTRRTLRALREAFFALRQERALERMTKTSIEIRSVPSATDARAKRLEITRGALEEILASGSLDRFRVVVEQLCENHDPFDVAAAALRYAEELAGNRTDDDTDIPEFTERPRKKRAERAPIKVTINAPETGMKRIFIGLGRHAGIRPGDVVGAIANEAGIPAKTIGAIHILDRFTLAEVSEAHAEHVVKSLQGLRLKGRSALVKFDEGPEGSTGRLPRKPRR